MHKNRAELLKYAIYLCINLEMSNKIINFAAANKKYL